MLDLQIGHHYSSHGQLPNYRQTHLSLIRQGVLLNAQPHMCAFSLQHNK